MSAAQKQLRLVEFRLERWKMARRVVEGKSNAMSMELAMRIDQDEIESIRRTY